MLTTFFEYVCMRVYPVTSLCVILKTWIETFAYVDMAVGCHENPQKPGHGGQLVKYVLLKDGVTSRPLTSRNHNCDKEYIIGVAFQHFFKQNQDSQPHDANITHTDKSNFLS